MEIEALALSFSALAPELSIAGINPTLTSALGSHPLEIRTQPCCVWRSLCMTTRKFRCFMHFVIKAGVDTLGLDNEN